MTGTTRRDFMMLASTATVGAFAMPDLLRGAAPVSARRRRVFVASSRPDGILAFNWDEANATLMPVGVAAKVPSVILFYSYKSN